MTPKADITPMARQDADALAALAAVCLPGEAWSEQTFAALPGNPLSTTLVLRVQGTVCGYVDCTTVCGEASINSFAIAPPLRRKGWGRRLLRDCIRCLREKQAESVTLEVRAGNAAALSLYRAEGFKQVGLRKNFYRQPTEDALLLTKNLLNSYTV